MSTVIAIAKQIVGSGVSNRTVSSSVVENRSAIKTMKQSPKSGGLLRLFRKDISFVIFFIIILQLTHATNFAPSDSLKSKYDINDPRNPDCPCHKHQQRAENEYKQLQGNLTNVYNNRINDNNSNENLRSGNPARERIEISFGFHKISFNRTKKVKTEKEAEVKGKKVKVRSGFTEAVAFYFVRKKFASTKAKTIKHRKMKGCLGDKLSRCFHF